MTEDARTLRKAKKNFFRSELRHKKTRQGQFDAAMLHLDHPIFPGGPALEASDGGKGAEAIRGLGALPVWQRLWVYERKRLKRKHRAVLDALLVDQRPRIAARIAGVSKNLVYECLGKIFKARFAQCYQALRADLGG